MSFCGKRGSPDPVPDPSVKAGCWTLRTAVEKPESPSSSNSGEDSTRRRQADFCWVEPGTRCRPQFPCQSRRDEPSHIGLGLFMSLYPHYFALLRSPASFAGLRSAGCCYPHYFALLRSPASFAGLRSAGCCDPVLQPSAATRGLRIGGRSPGWEGRGFEKGRIATALRISPRPRPRCPTSAGRARVGGRVRGREIKAERRGSVPYPTRCVGYRSSHCPADSPCARKRQVR